MEIWEGVVLFIIGGCIGMFLDAIWTEIRNLIFTPSLTPATARRKQQRLLKTLIKDWNQQINRAVNKGFSTAHIDYNQRFNGDTYYYSEDAIAYACDYFKGKGFKVREGYACVIISWEEK